MAKTPEEMCGKVITPRRVCGLTLNHNGGCEPTPPAPIAQKTGGEVTVTCTSNLGLIEKSIAAQTEKCSTNSPHGAHTFGGRPMQYCEGVDKPAEQVDAARLDYQWTLETMAIINKLTPNIKGKSFDPDWFLLRRRLEQMEERAASLKQETQPGQIDIRTCTEAEYKNRYGVMAPDLGDLRAASSSPLETPAAVPKIDFAVAKLTHLLADAEDPLEYAFEKFETFPEEIPDPTFKFAHVDRYKCRGVYAWLRGRVWLYVGMSDNIFRRITNHHVLGTMDEVVFEDEILIWETKNGYESARLEKLLIKLHEPIFNQMHNPNPFEGLDRLYV